MSKVVFYAPELSANAMILNDMVTACTDLNELSEKINSKPWDLLILELNKQNISNQISALELVRKKYNCFDLPIMVLTESINNDLKNYLAKQFVSQTLVNPSADELLEKTQGSLKASVTNDAIKRIVLQSFSDDPTLQKEPGLAKATAGGRSLYKVIVEQITYVVAKSGTLTKRQLEDMNTKSLAGVSSLYRQYGKMWLRSWPNRWTIEALIREGKNTEASQKEDSANLPAEIAGILKRASEQLE